MKSLHILALLFIPVFLFIPDQLNAQRAPEQDCINAIAVCQESYYQPNSYEGEGQNGNEIPTGGGCPGNCLASGEKNDVWYILTVQTGGYLGFVISPNNNNDDYDWAVYDLTNNECSDIYSMVGTLQVSCNYTATPGPTGPNGGSNSDCTGASGSPYNKLIPVNAGETYVINVSNYSSTQYGYTLDFSSSTAQIYDDVRPELTNVFGDGITCGSDSVDFQFSENVACASVMPGSFTLTGPDGEHEIVDIKGDACEEGGSWEKRYTAFIDPPFLVDGEYTFSLDPFNTIIDACDNIARPGEITFNVDLNAPEIDTTYKTITNATCGEDNGSITGLEVTGNEPLLYEWKDIDGNIVGTEVDLVDIGAGEYTLIVTDTYNCGAVAGPYKIQDEGAPEINTDDLEINASICSDDNGSILGLEIIGVSPFTFEWRDQNNNIVGDQLELNNVPGGDYTLYISDANGCEAITGPYHIDGFPPPLINTSTAFIVGDNCNMGNGSIEDVEVISDSPLEYRWYDQDGDTIGTSLDLINVYAGIYYLLVRDTNTCITISSGVEVEEVDGPDINTSSIDIHNTTCGESNGAIIGLIVTGNSGLTYQWQDEHGGTVGSDTSVLENVLPGEYTLYVTDAAGCESTGGPYTIINEGDPISVTASGNTPVCQGDNIELQVDFSNGSYNWTGPAGFTSDMQNPVISNVSIDDEGIYSVLVTSADQCEDESEVEIEVIESIPVSLSITESKNPIFPGEEVTFTADPTHPGFNPVYEWYIDGERVHSSSSNTFTTQIIVSRARVECYLLVEENCAEPQPAISNTINLDVLGVKVYLPNSFYPNSTQGNNIFKVVSISSQVADFKMNIYDRWGQNVFSSNSADDGWDGTIDGSEAPAGVYVWVVTYSVFESNSSSTTNTEKGTVMLLR